MEISEERLKAFINRDHAKYSTGVHVSVAEVQEIARQLLAYRDSGALEALREACRYIPLSGDMALMIRACQGGGKEAQERADSLIEHYEHLDEVRASFRAAIAKLEAIGK